MSNLVAVAFLFWLAARDMAAAQTGLALVEGAEYLRLRALGFAGTGAILLAGIPV